MSISKILGAFSLDAVEIPEKTRTIFRLSLLDWLAVSLAGRDEPVSRIIREMVMDEGGAGQATVIGGGKVPPRAAALANGTISHALDYDDTHFAHIGHPSVAVIPAALAVAEKTGATGAEFQLAAVIGAELSIRFGMWLGRGHYQTGFHQTATAGAIGATLAAARLLRLESAQTEHALGIVSTRAAGLKSQFGTMGKPFNAGIAASNGVEAATLAAAGFVSNPRALDAAQGFSATHAGAGDTAALDGLGQDWLFDRISHKFHACCHGLHACLEAARQLGAVAPEDIHAIHVRTHPRWMSVCNQPAPETGLGAKFSFTTVLPMHFLGHDTACLESYSDSVCADQALRALRNRVAVRADETLSETEAELSVIKTDGKTLQAACDLLDPEPLESRKDKMLSKASSLLGPDVAADLWELVRNDAGPKALSEKLRGG